MVHRKCHTITSHRLDTYLNKPGLPDLCPAPAYLTFVTALQLAISKNDVITGYSERVRPTEKPYDVYDFIVVGGGCAGSIVASRLSENPKWNVLLLEAGGDEPFAIQVPGLHMISEIQSAVNWDYKTKNETYACLSYNGSCTWSSGKMLGGSTAHNTMLYIRGNPTDFNNWADLGNEGWAWDEVKPYFLKVEDNGEIDRVGREYHSTGGPQSFERFPYVPPFSKFVFEAASELGYNLTEDVNGNQLTGFTIVQTMTKNGVRHSSAAAYLRPARHRKNLHVCLNSLVTKVIIENDTAVGVQYHKNGVFKTVKANKEVILSAGAKRSPQLLLLSGVGPRKHLESSGVKAIEDLPGVGQNLQNHLVFSLSFTINEPDTYDNNWKVAEEYLANQTGPLSCTGLSQVVGLIASNNTTPDYPDMILYFSGYEASCAPGDVGALNSMGNRIVSIGLAYLHPKSRGRISLASKNPLKYPYIWSNGLSNANDVDRLLDGIERIFEFADTATLKALNFTLATEPVEACSEYIFRSSDYWKCAVRQGYINNHHDAGTCKMGPKSDSMAVVDQKLRVYGIKQLRIADASIIPKLISGNLGATVMMIGERAADFMKADHCRNRKFVHRQSSPEGLHHKISEHHGS